jgi:hypothetical protein
VQAYAGSNPALSTKATRQGLPKIAFLLKTTVLLGFVVRQSVSPSARWKTDLGVSLGVSTAVGFWGPPLADFSYNAMMYHMPLHIVAGLAGTDLQTLNIPTEEEYVATYCRRTGRDGIPNRSFYTAFNFFRLAAIFHGIKGRVMRGTAASAQAAERARYFPDLAEIARRMTG